MTKVGRNNPCPCGSGKKFKHCCMGAHSAAARPVIADNAIGVAIELHRAGRLPEAERAYRAVLAREPEHADALHLLGLIAHRAGNLAAAVALIERAITAQPSSPVPLNNLGTVLQDQGKLDEAQARYRQALALDPGYAEAYCNLANVLDALGRIDDAITAYRRALALNPRFAEAHHNLANVQRRSGDHDGAIAGFRAALALRPDLVRAHVDLGQMLQQCDEAAAAIAAFGQALACTPDDPHVRYSLAVALQEHGQLDAAAAAFRRVIEVDAASAPAHSQLGLILDQLGQRTEAIAHYRRALELAPGLSEAHCNLGLALQHQGQLDEAIACFEQALACNPESAVAYSNLALPLQHQGRLEEAVAAYRQALAIKPDFAEAYSNLLLTMQYMPGYSALERFAEHLRFAEQVEAPLKPLWRAHRNPPEPARRLRIGYVSGDFRAHAVAYFIEPILANHDKAGFEVYCYASHAVHDAVSDRIAAAADHWLACKWLSDERLAQRIRADGIDILIDLSGHTAHNRLPTFARKPAPVQMTWIGYPATTGLAAMDYRLTEECLDPVGMTERFHTETLLRLPSGAAFQPAPESPAVNALPALTSGQLSLACLNNLVKINAAVVRVWARILQALPQAHLVLGAAADPRVRSRLEEMFAREGVAADRLIVFTRLPIGEYLALHHHIDLALDPFPYNGGTTSCHSLWMGVPVVTLAGRDTASRYGVALMQGLGLTQFIAANEDEYVERVIALAGDLPQLNRIRQSLRERIAANVDRDPSRLTRHLEAAYRTAWTRWCDKRHADGGSER